MSTTTGSGPMPITPRASVQATSPSGIPAQLSPASQVPSSRSWMRLM